MLIVSQINVGSSHGVFGTLTVAGDMIKLVKITRPARIAEAGTLIAFPICLQPYPNVHMRVSTCIIIYTFRAHEHTTKIIQKYTIQIIKQRIIYND